MPNLHYLILAHAQPENLKALVEALDSKSVYIHIDAKSEIEPFLEVVKNAKFIEKRIRLNWGGFSSIRATFELIRAARPMMQDGDYAILLSGDTFPLASKQNIEKFFSYNQGTEFLECVKMPNSDYGKPLYRIKMFYFEFNAKGRGIHIEVMDFMNRVLRKLAPRDWKKAFGDLVPHGGGHWFALTTGALDYLLDQFESRKEFVKFCRNTNIPDEHFHQTLMANSPFANKIKPSVMFNEFFMGAENASVLTKEHIAKFKNEGQKMIGMYGPTTFLFARKVVSEEIRQEIRQGLWSRSMDFEEANGDR